MSKIWQNINNGERPLMPKLMSKIQNNVRNVRNARNLKNIENVKNLKYQK